jgi:protein TonB
MINERKSAKADLKKTYNITLQSGLIASLFIIIILVRINLYSEPPTPPPIEIQEEVVMEDIEITKQIETPPPPPRPPVPVEVPNDQLIEDDVVDLDLDFDLDGPMDLPPPPPPADDDDEDFFIVVEQMPEPIGGIAAVQKLVKYPEMARRAGIEGRVTIQFVVSETGEIENPVVMRGIGGGCDEAALEAVKKAKFTPGMQRGRPVRVQFSLPIFFRLQN